MGVDSQLTGKTGLHYCGDRGDLIGHCPPIGIAEHEHICPSVSCCTKCREGKLRIILVTVEEMLCIVEYLSPLGFQIGHAIGNHRQIFGMGNAEYLFDLELPAFPKNGDHRGFCFQQLRYLGIIFYCNPSPTGAAKSGQLGTPEVGFPSLRKEGKILGIGTGPPPLDIIHPERGELFRNPDLVDQTERDPLPLRSVAQSGVIQGD